MKKIIKFFILLVVAGFTLPVFAANTGELIPIGEKASIETDMFTYSDISYVATVPGKSFGRFTFSNVVNKTTKQVPISIDILLFDSNRINIGFLAYCTDEDVGGEYAQKKLKAGASSPFSINVTSKYFIETKGTSDVAYYAVLDDNPYCHVGGYNKYEGLTIEEIVGGKVTIKTDDGKEVDVDVTSLFSGVSMMILLIALFAIIVMYVVQGIILNALHKRMFASTTALAYLPIAGNYVAVKLAFGGNVAKIYILAYFASFASVIIKPLVILTYLLSFVSAFAFILDIVKLITKKYNLFYLEPMTMNENVDLNTNFTSEVQEETSKKEDYTLEDEPIGEGGFKPNDLEENPSSSLGNSFLNGTSGQEVIDLNYSDTDSSNLDNTRLDTSNSFNYNVDDFVNFSDNSMPEVDSNENNNESTNTNNNQKEGDSALMDLFK